jgi:putative ABC transport system substrate-binding protein
MRRRDFIKVIGGGAAVWPLSARAQQAERVRIIGATTSLSENDREDKVRSAAFRQSLQELGWTVSGNVRIEYRYGFGNAERIRKNAAELVALAPDVILVTGTPSLEPLLRGPDCVRAGP